MANQELRFLSLRELSTIETTEDKYLIEGFLWECDHIVVLAKEKVGKSIFSMQMACALSSGRPFLNEYNVFEPMQVAYISTEGKQHELVERFKSMMVGIDVGLDNLHVLSTHSIALDTEDGYNIVNELLIKQNLSPKVIILDPLYMSMQGDLSDNKSSRAMARNIRKLGEDYKAAIVLVHHEHRPKRSEDGITIEEGDGAIMGSFVWKAFPDHVLHIKKLPDGLRTITCTTQRNTRVIQDMKMELVSNPLHYQIVGNVDHPISVDMILDLIEKNHPISSKELEIATGLATATIRRALAYLQKSNVNKIRKENPGSRPVYFVPASWKDSITAYEEAKNGALIAFRSTPS